MFQAIRKLIGINRLQDIFLDFKMYGFLGIFKFIKSGEY